MEIYTETLEVQRIKTSIAEGEMILKSGKTCIGRKMSKEELEGVKRSINNAKAKIGSLNDNQ